MPLIVLGKLKVFAALKLSPKKNFKVHKKRKRRVDKARGLLPRKTRRCVRYKRT